MSRLPWGQRPFSIVHNSVLNVKALEGAFNQEKALVGALVGAFSVIMKTHCETDGSSAALIWIEQTNLPPYLTQRNVMSPDYHKIYFYSSNGRKGYKIGNYVLMFDLTFYDSAEYQQSCNNISKWYKLCCQFLSLICSMWQWSAVGGQNMRTMSSFVKDRIKEQSLKHSTEYSMYTLHIKIIGYPDPWVFLYNQPGQAPIHTPLKFFILNMSFRISW